MELTKEAKARIVKIIEATARLEYFQERVLAQLHWGSSGREGYPASFVDELVSGAEEYVRDYAEDFLIDLGDEYVPTAEYERSLEAKGFKTLTQKAARHSFYDLLKGALLNSSAECASAWYVDEDPFERECRVDQCIGEFSDEIDRAMRTVI